MQSVQETKENFEVIDALPYDALALTFSYPDSNYKSNLQKTFEILEQQYPAAATEMVEFCKFVEDADLVEIQELYLRSFDVQSITTLDIGYVLFGDDYKRGQLLVHLNREHQEAKNEITTELADHLPNVMRLLPRMDDRELAAELVHRIVGPGIWKMVQDFDPDKIRKKDEVYKKHLKTLLDVSMKYRTIFSSLLRAVVELLETDFAYEQVPIEESQSDFIKNVGSEMQIEEEHE